MEKQSTSSIPSRSKRSLSSAPSRNAKSLSSAPPHLDTKEGIESNEEIPRGVPVGSESNEEIQNHCKDTSGQKWIEEPTEEERLLMRKIGEDFTSYLENRVKEAEKRISEIEETLYDMKNEYNQILRDILMNTTGDSRELEKQAKDSEKEYLNGKRVSLICRT